jgi:hypothetical protein
MAKTGIKNRSALLFALAPILGILAGVVYLNFESKHAQKSEPEVIAQSALDKINPFPVNSAARGEFILFNRWMRDNTRLMEIARKTHANDILALAGNLEKNGISRLPDSSLEGYSKIFGQILISMNGRACAEFLRGNMSFDDFTRIAYPVIGSLDSKDARTWFSINEMAIDAEINGLPEKFASQVKIRRAIQMISERLPADESTLFKNEVLALNTDEDAQLCSVVNTLFSEVSNLPEPYRGQLARLLLTAKAQ